MRNFLVMCGRRSAGIALLAVAMAVPACLESQTASRRQLPARLSTETRSAIERLADSLGRAKVPVEPLYDKAAEGVLKGADDSRILRAVRSLARELASARAALGPSAASAEILAGASALHAGVLPDDLRKLARERQHPRGTMSLAVPLTVLADLVTRRVPPGVATASVSTLISGGAAEDDFTALRAEVQRDISSGLAPAAAAAARTQAFIRANPRAGTPIAPMTPPRR